MELTMTKAIWDVFNDICIMAVLLLIGQILRAKVKIFQKLLISFDKKYSIFKGYL